MLWSPDTTRNWENVFVIMGVQYVGFVSIHFAITGLRNIVRYTGVFVIPGSSLYRGLCYTGVFVIPRSSLYRGLRFTGVFVIPESSLYRGLRYTGVFVIPGLCYTGVFVIPGSSLYQGLRYTGVFVIPGSSLHILSGFYCTKNHTKRKQELNQHR